MASLAIYMVFIHITYYIWYITYMINYICLIFSSVRLSTGRRRRIFYKPRERGIPYTTLTRYISLNSLAPGGFENIFQNVFFKLISWIDTLSNSCETALRSMPQNPSDDKSTLVQVMAWCRQAASHYLSQCCPKSLSPYGVTRPQWVNTMAHRKNGFYLSAITWVL